MTSPDTKDRILNAAEQLFGDLGPSATSLRSITAAAGVNLAAVNYHFGSKEKLIEAVLARRLEPMNRDRLVRLDALEARDQEIALEELLDAFLRPAFRMGSDPAAGVFCSRLIGRLQTDPAESVREIFKDQFKEVAERFLPAFVRACPHLSPGELLWRVFFLIGALSTTLMDAFDLKAYSEGLCDPHDIEQTTSQLVHFGAAAFRAPAARVHAAEAGEGHA